MKARGISAMAVVLVLFFTVSVSAEGIDEYTKLMIHSDTFHGDMVFEDSSLEPHLVAGLGASHHSTVQAKFGNTSIRFDGGSDYLTVPDSEDWDFGDDDFTVEAWIFPRYINPEGWHGIVSHYYLSSFGGCEPGWDGWILSFTKGELSFRHDDCQEVTTLARVYRLFGPYSCGQTNPVKVKVDNPAIIIGFFRSSKCSAGA